MFTIKLSSFSPCEVDYLLTILNYEVILHCEGESNGKQCPDCDVRHLCYALNQLYRYLEKERTEGYPHCKRR